MPIGISIFLADVLREGKNTANTIKISKANIRLLIILIIIEVASLA